MASQVKALQEETAEMKAILTKLQDKMQKDQTKIEILEKESVLFKEFCKKKKKKKAIRKRRSSEVVVKEEEQASMKCKAKTRINISKEYNGHIFNSICRYTI